MTRIGVLQSVRSAIYAGLVFSVSIAIGQPAIATDPPSHVLSSSQGQPPQLLAQSVEPEVAPAPSDSSTNSQPEREIEFTSPTFNLGVQGSNVQEPLEAGAQQDAAVSGEAEPVVAEHEWVEFSVEESDEAIARFGCDDLFCINALREQRGLPPLQLVWDAQQRTNGDPR